jgi:hypothetical protein
MMVVLAKRSKASVRQLSTITGEPAVVICPANAGATGSAVPRTKFDRKRVGGH